MSVLICKCPWFHGASQRGLGICRWRSYPGIPGTSKWHLPLMVFSSVYHCPLLNHLLTPSYATGFQAFLPYFLGKCLFNVGIDVTKDLLCIYVKCQLGVSFKTRRMTRINSENRSAKRVVTCRHISCHILYPVISSPFSVMQETETILGGGNSKIF